MASKSFLFATNASNNDTLLQLIMKSVPNMLQMLSYNLQKYDTHTSVQHQVCYNYVSSAAELQQLQDWTKPALQTFTWPLNSCKYATTASKKHKLLQICFNCFRKTCNNLLQTLQFSIQFSIKYAYYLNTLQTKNANLQLASCSLLGTFKNIRPQNLNLIK